MSALTIRLPVIYGLIFFHTYQCHPLKICWVTLRRMPPEFVLHQVIIVLLILHLPRIDMASRFCMCLIWPKQTSSEKPYNALMRPRVQTYSPNRIPNFPKSILIATFAKSELIPEMSFLPEKSEEE